MSKSLKEIDYVIGRIGGIAATAKLCDLTDHAVIKWRVKRQIPHKHWPILAENGITYARLAKIFELSKEVA